MGARTAIAWTDSTFNPVIGCEAISPGCDHCYAAAYAKRVGRDFSVRTRTSDANWALPVKWNREAEAAGKRRRVFCASLADVFDNQWPDGVLEELFHLVDATPWLDWQFLTKRIANALVYRFPKNVHLGITVTSQKEADRDIPKLLAANVAVRFLSVEPQLERIDLCEIFGIWWNQSLQRFVPLVPNLQLRFAIDWVICGGESGPGARAFDIDWARALKRQCAAVGVPFFMKQLGAHTIWRGTSLPGAHWPRDTKFEDIGGCWRVWLRDRAGADPAEWPDDLRVQEFLR